MHIGSSGLPLQSIVSSFALLANGMIKVVTSSSPEKRGAWDGANIVRKSPKAQRFCGLKVRSAVVLSCLLVGGGGSGGLVFLGFSSSLNRCTSLCSHGTKTLLEWTGRRVIVRNPSKSYRRYSEPECRGSCDSAVRVLFPPFLSPLRFPLLSQESFNPIN